MNINSVTLSGRLTADPEIKYFDSGAMNAKFTIAVDGWENGEKTAYFFNAEVWNSKDGKGQAQYTADYARKGMLVIVQGSLGQQKWQDRETGQKREKTVIKVSSIVIPKTAHSEQHEEPAPAPDPKPPQTNAVEPDDIPF